MPAAVLGIFKVRTKAANLLKIWKSLEMFSSLCSNTSELPPEGLAEGRIYIAFSTFLPVSPIKGHSWSPQESLAFGEYRTPSLWKE